MSIFENPNTTAVDDLYRYFKKGVFGTDNDSQQTSEEQEISYPQTTYPPDSPDVTQFNPVVTQIPNAFWYPEEIAFQNDRNAPRNIMKISIKDYEGAQLKTNRFLRDAGSGTINLLKNEYDLTKNVFGEAVGKIVDPTNPGNNTNADQTSQSFDNFQKVGQQFFDKNKQVFNNETFDQTFNTKQLEATKTLGTIFLYAPTDVETSYKFHYQDSDLSDISRLIDMVRSFSNDGNSGVGSDVLKQLGVSLLDSFLDKAGSSFVTQPNGGINFKDFLQSRSRAVPVENWEYLFRRVSRRKFNFEFKMYPKSINEIKHVFSIINLLKYYSHPEKVANSRYLNAPAVFHVEHLAYDGNTFKENLLINRIKPAALQQLDITYTEGGGAFTTLAPDLLENRDPKTLMKSPVGINVKLFMEELNILTRDDLTAIENFFNPSYNGPDGQTNTPDSEKYH